MSKQQVLIGGQWKDSEGTQTFQSTNPATKEKLPGEFPVSPWSEVEAALNSAAAAHRQMRGWPGERFAVFLEEYANQIEARADELVTAANLETALPAEPRLRNGELPRTTGQLRQAATAARNGSWTMPAIDTQTNIRSMFGPIGPVAVFGPNNFPFAFNSISGGDFAAAVAAGNPVIAKANSSHPETTRIFAEAAKAAAEATDMPAGFVQLIYRTSHADGAKLVAHPLLGATGYTGARGAGLVLKDAADKAGKPIYLELSSINPVYLLANALEERGEELAQEFTGSCLMGTGQFCTNPGMVILPAGEAAEKFLAAVSGKFTETPSGTLLSEGVEKSLKEGISELQKAGAELLAQGSTIGNGYSVPNTLLKVDAATFLNSPEALQTEAFGNSSLFVIADSVEQMVELTESLEGNLTGTIYSETSGKDDDAYDMIAASLREKVGRLLNDKMPTGVAVTNAMNHGGPFPATGHPGFTAVGIPAAVHRFGMLHCYDNVREHRLPAALKNLNPGNMWRNIDGAWTQSDV